MQADRMDVEADDSAVKRKGRGFSSREDRDDARAGAFETIPASDTADKAQRSIEGWIIIVTNVHEEANEDDLIDRFSDYGEVKNLHLNLDRRTGYVKGYALVEYETKEEALKAIAEAPQEPFLEKVLACDFAFVQPPAAAPAPKEPARGGRGRSASPVRKPLVTRID
ncbi:hypothetical protein Rhopal_003168-T1 [Rhodotorula paludigena]|uniref:RRM domain-containing protein n=1 Tax=Rhodotorula paludigena TaxID=86838 RepID=A0AAV5GLN2_9BASI|nr:hypothetical protein Rhopal_003168-T1 [Rhodotorula paludigena]